MKTMTGQMTTDEQYAVVVEKMKALGLRVPARGAWKETVGHMKGSQHFAEAMRLGAEWRAEVNRQSIEELNARS
ncbi:MAG: hypothetical protein ACKVY0_06885 [Prosthecobacter sp.]|uniref:hypothetical protein n=1 Tax=Prosthecobacter sp. TaxID=1965333 RepID=UPI003901D797